MNNIAKDLKELPAILAKNTNDMNILQLLNRAVQALEILAMAAESIDQRMPGGEKTSETKGARDVLDFFTGAQEFENFLKSIITSKRTLGDTTISSLEINRIIRKNKKLDENLRIQISHRMAPSLLEKLGMKALPGPGGSVCNFEILPE